MKTKINSELERLNLTHEYSGLTAVDIDSNTVTLFDDYFSSEYNSLRLIDCLAQYQAHEISLNSESENNIWQLIADCEV